MTVVCQTQWKVSRNAAVLVASTITFKCHTNSTSRVFWTYRAKSSNSDVEVDVCRQSYDEKFIDRCSVTNHTDGTYALAVSDVRLNDSGFYGCADIGNKEKATAHLVVLGKNLLCLYYIYMNTLYKIHAERYARPNQRRSAWWKCYSVYSVCVWLCLSCTDRSQHSRFRLLPFFMRRKRSKQPLLLLIQPQLSQRDRAMHRVIE